MHQCKGIGKTTIPLYFGKNYHFLKENMSFLKCEHRILFLFL